MARWWLGIALLCVGWLGIAPSGHAQFLPTSDGSAPAAGQFFQVPPTQVAPGNGAAAPAVPPGNAPPAGPVFAGGPPGCLPGAAGPADPGVPTAPVEGCPSAGGDIVENAFVENCCEPIPPNRFHANFEYLYWWFEKQPLPILVTSGPFSDAVPAAIGQPGTKILIDSVGANRPVNGGQLTLSWDCDPERILVLEAGGFGTEQRAGQNGVSGNGAIGSRAIGRPFFNANANTFDADPVALPGVMKGVVTVSAPTQLFGGEVNLRYNYWDAGLAMERATFLIGARYLELDEKLVVDESTSDLPGLGQPGNNYKFQDNFKTYDRFYGGQIGLEGEWRLGNMVVTLLGKIACGDNDMTAQISGATAIRQPNGTVSVSNNQAVLVQPSNAGTFHQNRVGILPAGDFRVGYDFNEFVRFSVGYSFLYWFDVLRPGNQIDNTLNIRSLQPFDQIAPARPGVPLQESSFWAQGLNISLLISF